jgi:protein arginine kinase activator
MLCQDCNKNEATVHVAHVINNQKVILNLCEECATRRGFTNPLKNAPFPLADFLSSMVGESSLATSEKIRESSCSKCGLTFATFAKTGRLGCGACFEAFREPLSDLLRKIHGSHIHRGKRPTGRAADMEPLKEESRLREELQKAISTEDFEKAAQIRDLLKEVQRKLQATDV